MFFFKNMKAWQNKRGEILGYKIRISLIQKAIYTFDFETPNSGGALALECTPNTAPIYSPVSNEIEFEIRNQVAFFVKFLAWNS